MIKVSNRCSWKDLSNEELIEKYDIMTLGMVRGYIGVFSGKMVKPLDCNEDEFKKFHKGDQVVVYNLQDFIKFQKSFDKIKESLKTNHEPTLSNGLHIY